MTKQEFETLIEGEVSSEDYKLIEFVYVWHPNIGNVNGKRQVAELYKVGGIEIFKDMRNAAQITFNYQEKIEEKRRQICRLQEEIGKLADECEEALKNR